MHPLTKKYFVTEPKDIFLTWVDIVAFVSLYFSSQHFISGPLRQIGPVHL